jgi:hypothetical protein
MTVNLSGFCWEIPKNFSFQISFSLFCSFSARKTVFLTESAENRMETPKEETAKIASRTNFHCFFSWVEVEQAVLLFLCSKELVFFDQKGRKSGETYRVMSCNNLILWRGSFCSSASLAS